MEIQMVGAPDPQQKCLPRALSWLYLSCFLELLTSSRIDCLYKIVDILKPLVSTVDLVPWIHFGASDMKVFDLTENEQRLLWQVDILTKNFMIFSDLIIWNMGYLHEVY